LQGAFQPASNSNHDARRINLRASYFSAIMNDDPLLLEIGNSTVKLAQQRGDGTFAISRYDRLDDAIGELERSSGRVLCAAVGRELSAALLSRLAPERVRVITNNDLRGFIGDSYDTPDTLGLDRVLNLLGLDGDGIAISCGTAITADAFANGVPLWGAILPGFRTAANGLHERVPALPLVEPQSPTGLPARTSYQSVANGVLLGTALALRGIADHLATAAGLSNPRIILTGGDAEVLKALWQIPDIEIDDGLLFRGMMSVG
jgi:pantothenate kinase type III